MTEPDWKLAQDTIINKAQEAIATFGAEHPNEPCSFFALLADYFYGDVAICFDTLENSVLQAKKHQSWVVKNWTSAFASDRGQEDARSNFTRNKIVDHSPSAGFFKYARSALLGFPEWEGYFGSDDLPDTPDPQRHVMLLLYGSLEHLIQTAAFAKLATTSPFRIGFEIPESTGLVVTRILNWPS